MEVGGEREIIYLSLHCHHQNDLYIKVGSDERHFDVSLIMTDKVTSQCPQTTTFEEKESRSGFELGSLCLPASRLSARPNRLTGTLTNQPTNQQSGCRSGKLRYGLPSNRVVKRRWYDFSDSTGVINCTKETILNLSLIHI